VLENLHPPLYDQYQPGCLIPFEEEIVILLVLSPH
jgi:hypothetical protein